MTIASIRFQAQALLCCSFLFAFGVAAEPTTPTPSASSSPSKSTSAIQVPIQKISAAVFEVVVPRITDKFVQYEHPLPFDKLPFAVRTDQYDSLGTAFAIGPNQFVSAAHVFSFPVNAREGEFFLRDQGGKVYKVGKVLKLSTDRDLIEFEIKDPPKDLSPLATSDASSIGEAVFAVGNALGEGISYRDGMLSSYTPEEVQNRWKFIRFSAPASPGNSGGPLINANGQVIGVIERKNSTENLNYAIPIAELTQLSSDQADFFIKNIEFKRGPEVATKEWHFNASLPNSFQKLAHQSEESLRKFELSLLDTLNSRSDERFPPSNPKWREYLRHPDAWGGLSYINYNPNNSSWSINKITTRTQSFGEEEHYRIAKVGEHELVLIELLKNETLKDLMSSPEHLMERVLKALSFSRKFLNENIKITSLGKPETQDKWTDDVNRAWTSFGWKSGELQEQIELSCLPTPSGPLCDFSFVSSNSTLPAREEYYQKAIYSLLTSYEGTFAQWKDFLNLDQSMLPDVFKKSSFKIMDEHGIQLKLGGQKVEFHQKDLTPESRMAVKTTYSPKELLDLEIPSISITPIYKGTVYQIFEIVEPMTDSPEHAKTKWNDLKTRSGHYDGKPYTDKDWTDIARVLPASDSNDKPKRVFHTFCSTKKDKPDPNFQTECSEFFNSVKF